ncbi:hypothetical protein E4U17_003484 [Claviceps sp. LM77 group G4]|nr:hypothetical protein E4U17_003484 [Claviceps sp. LM77 group G4]KAG6077301.1 hypothetical protein E4U16_002320 [Claviceps sp. LM84 group G4]
MSSALSTLDDHSKASIEAFIPSATSAMGLLQDRLQQREGLLAQSEAARKQQGAQLLELNQVIQQVHGA